MRDDARASRSRSVVVAVLCIAASACAYRTKTVSYEWSYGGKHGGRTKSCIEQCEKRAMSSTEELACIRTCPGVERYDSDCDEGDYEMCIAEDVEELDVLGTAWRAIALGGGLAVSYFLVLRATAGG